MVMLQQITVVHAIKIAQMIVMQIVQVNGVAMLQQMSVVHVIQTHLMIVHKIVQVTGVVIHGKVIVVV